MIRNFFLDEEIVGFVVLGVGGKIWTPLVRKLEESKGLDMVELKVFKKLESTEVLFFWVFRERGEREKRGEDFMDER